MNGRQVVRAIEQGEADRFLALRFDRISRQGISFAGKLISLCQDDDITFSTVVEGDALDTSTGVGRIFMSIIAELAAAESESLGTRQKLRHRAAAAGGEMHAAGRRPYGFNYQGNVIEDEATIIREVAERLVRGKSLRSITRLRTHLCQGRTGGSGRRRVAPGLRRRRSASRTSSLERSPRAARS